ncbi:hypothetical protein CDD81_158 [Ophiocordyceps australis]|uniref:Transcription initiation factor TFIID subunit 8 n=1 Tax=Ophiocordyceps australis TaxID=1399860 RepID=A0A2C5XNC2_9HYPO|nr:hypothetical protein CDD81_158 [Ophiocordyceps australis]
MSTKRSISSHDSARASEAKRPRLEMPSRQVSLRSLPGAVDASSRLADAETEAQKHLKPHHIARCNLQRSLALALKHVGFDTATPLAMDSFTNMVEEYMQHMVQELKAFSLTARREHPTPVDFGLTLNYFNLSTWTLRPHLKNPIPRSQLAPRYVEIPLPDKAQEATAVLPLLTPHLSGKAEKEAQAYIPSFLPDFPSRHTYRFTPAENTSARDSKKVREEAARTAQHGEDALRGLVRASKVRKRKEVKSLVERDSQGRERFRLWESCMRRFTSDCGDRGESSDRAAKHVEITEQSMIVNAQATFSRKEVPRQNKRTVTGLSTGS